MLQFWFDVTQKKHQNSIGTFSKTENKNTFLINTDDIHVYHGFAFRYHTAVAQPKQNILCAIHARE